MAHFAELNNDGIVTRVIVVHNNELLDEHGDEQEALGVLFCQRLLGGRWVQTSYNGNFRKQYCGAGYTYDEVRDEFVQPQPFPSWILDENNDWQPPTPRPPKDEHGWRVWDEESLSWVQQ